MTPDPQMFVELTTARSPLEVEAIVAALGERGIQAMGFNHAAATLQMSWTPLTVSVHRGDLDRATALLAEIKADSAELDWDKVDVGEMPDEVARELERKSLRFGAGKKIGFFLAMAPLVAGAIAGIILLVRGVMQLYK